MVNNKWLFPPGFHGTKTSILTLNTDSHGEKARDMLMDKRTNVKDQEQRDRNNKRGREDRGKRYKDTAETYISIIIRSHRVISLHTHTNTQEEVSEETLSRTNRMCLVSFKWHRIQLGLQVFSFPVLFNVVSTFQILHVPGSTSFSHFWNNVRNISHT